MKTDKIIFANKKEYDNGKIFEFIFESWASNQNIDKNKINGMLINFINNKVFDKDMPRNVSFLRTILKDFEEKILVIKSEDIINYEVVVYYHGILSLFRCKTRSEESENSLNVEFTPGKGLNITFMDYEDNIIDYPNCKNINEQFSELIKHIGLLKSAEAINLDLDSKTLIEIYKLFYNENPDFSLPNINVKIQTMMSILIQFGISLGDDYAFSLLGKFKMPISINLEQVVNKLFPLGEIDNIDDPVKIAEKPKKIIKIVGECVREVINDGYNKDEALITISKVIHAGRYSLSSSCNIGELCQFTNCTQNEVESSIRLVKHIEKKLDKLDK